MFGYVIVNSDELKVKDFDSYQSFYCGLCQTLRQRYGRIAQTALNFDMNFLAILLSGLYEPMEELSDYRCGFHPTRKRVIKKNNCIEYAADMTVVLTYLKCEDDWIDDKKISRLAYKKLLNGYYKKVEQLYPEKIAAIQTAMQQLTVCEHENCQDIDQVSALFGKVMGEIVSYQDDEWKHTLYRLGDYLGRFIYLMDAYDDVADDLKHQQYNPFAKDFHASNFEDRANMILELMIAEAAQTFETLPILAYIDILRNIIYSGIWSKYVLIKKKRSGEDNGSV